MFKRELYIKKIRPYIDKPFIKVLTGIRRSGKSVILKLLKKEFLEKGILEDHIIYINFENLDYSDIDDAKKLDQYVKSKILDKDRYYLLLDEIQEVKGWERAINSLMASTNSDIYITGSNSKLLSSELATYIAGRYIEIKIYTLSFREYLEFKGLNKDNCDIKKELKEFIRMGGFPAISIGNYEHDEAYELIKDIYSSAILRDTVQRYNIRNVELLERVVKFVFDNIGNIFSAKNVADYFKSQQRKVDLNTIYNYLNALESAYIIQKIQRYDIKGKEILQTNEKYFVGDHSLIYGVMGYKDRMISGILENIVLNELLKRGYKVYVGKLGNKEVDFIAEKKEDKIYIQVTYILGNSQSTIDREFNPLLEIHDHYHKYVVSMDDFWSDNIEGVKHKNLAEFLLMEEY